MVLFEKGTYVFLPDEDHCYVPAQVTTTFEPGKIGAVKTLSLTNKKDENHERQTKISAKLSQSIQSMDDQSLRDWEDMVLLKQLDNASLLHNLRVRYAKDEIYTNIGTILISVNPYKLVTNLFAPEVTDRFINCGGNTAEMPPHIYGVAEHSFYQMMNYDQDQSCIITGESGAGKTEATKLYLQYIAERTRRNRDIQGPSSSNPSRQNLDVPLREKILGANPLMEAFGNAKTVRNDNSSRFGKLIDVFIDRKRGVVSGGQITNYLLEKSRVVRHLEGERSYHVFYQLCAAANEFDGELKPKYKLLPAEEFYYLNQSQNPSTIIDGVDDCAEWEATLASMRLLKISDEDKDAVIRVLSGILHLGNVTFSAQGNTDFAQVSNEESLETAANMFGIEPQELARGLLTRDISNRAEKVIQKHNVREANESRDALAKHTYSRLFNWLTLCINKALSSKMDEFNPNDRRTIAVLDIFGFESFGHNSFEQLCINYCNEKLQGFFNNHIFKLEQMLYKQEEIDVSQIGFSDNQGVIDTIDHRSTGIFAICDDEVNLLRGTDDGFLSKVILTAKDLARKAKAAGSEGTGEEERSAGSFSQKVRRRASSFHQTMTMLNKKPLDGKVFLKEPNVKEMRKNEGARNSFIVVHFAGEVMYNVEGFLEKNRDILRNDLLDVVRSSDVSLLQQLFDDVEDMPGAKSKAISRKTLGRKFQEQLDQLMVRLQVTEPHFVRTIKPNAQKKPMIFEEPLVLDQLRYAGLLEVCRIRQMGYPVRKDHMDFFQTFCCIRKDAKTLDELLAFLVEDGHLYGTEWQKGKTKMFMRAAQFDSLCKEREKALYDVTVLLQSRVRGFLKRNKYVRAKTVFQDLERGIKDRDRKRLENAIPFASNLPNAVKHAALLERAKRVLSEIKEEEKLLVQLETAVSSNSVGELPSLIKSAEQMGLGDRAIVKEARELVKRSDEEKRVMQALVDAVDSRKISELESALEGANEYGLESTAQAKAARALLDRLQEEERLVSKLEAAMARKDLDEMGDLIQALVDLGAGSHPVVLKAQKMTKRIISESEARKKALDDLNADLLKAIEDEDLDALNNLRVRIEELGASGPIVDRAMELRRQLEERGTILEKIALEKGILSKKSMSIDGIVSEDLDALTDSLEDAKSYGLTEVKFPEVRDAARFLERMKKQLEVQDLLEVALEENTYSKLLEALLEAQALSMVTANAQRVAEEVRNLEKIKLALHRIDERKLREKRMSMLRYANKEEQEEVEKDRLKCMDSEDYGRTLEEAEQSSNYQLENYYRIRDDDDYTDSFPSWERDGEASLKLYSKQSPIPKSVHEVDEDQNVIAVRVNRAILQYCGEIASTNTAGLAQYIVVNGLCDPRLADEIYIQLCKHLRGNQSKKSEDRTWLLMCMCTKYFPPSEVFSHFLLNFLLDRRSRPSLEGNYARLCVAQLGATLEIGASKYKPSLEELGEYAKRPPVLASIQIIDGRIVTLPVSPDMRLDVVTKLIRQKTGILDAVKRQAWSVFVKDGEETNNDSLRDRLVRFYKVHNPARLQHVEVYVQHWQGREEELFHSLVEKYGPEPIYNAARPAPKSEGSKPGLSLPITVARAAVKFMRVNNVQKSSGPSPKIAWPLPMWVFIGDVFSRMSKQHREPTFVFKRRFLPVKGKADLHLFQQLQNDVETESLIITSDHDVAELAAISMALEHPGVEFEDESKLVSMGLARHIPPSWLREKKDALSWARTIIEMDTIGSEGDTVLRQRYCDICKKAPAYGKSLFHATRSDSKRPYVIGIDTDGVHVMSPSLDTIIRSFPHRAIKKYGAVAGTFWMKLSKSKLDKDSKKEGKSVGKRISRRFMGAKPADLKQTTTGLAGSSKFDFLKRDDGLDVVLNTIQSWEMYDCLFNVQQVLKEEK